MAKFRVVGAREIDGVAPGGVVEIKDDSGVNVGALLSAGHLELIDEKPADKPDTKSAKAKADKDGGDDS